MGAEGWGFESPRRQILPYRTFHSIESAASFSSIEGGGLVACFSWRKPGDRSDVHQRLEIEWLRRPNPGSDRAPLPTAERRQETDGWRWKNGMGDGTSAVGGSTSPPGRPKRRESLCGSVPTLAARWGMKGSSMIRNKQQNGL